MVVKDQERIEAILLSELSADELVRVDETAGISDVGGSEDAGSIVAKRKRAAKIGRAVISRLDQQAGAKKHRG